MDRRDLVVAGPQQGPWRRRLLGWSDETLAGHRDSLVIEMPVRNEEKPGFLRRLAERAFF